MSTASLKQAPVFPELCSCLTQLPCDTMKRHILFQKSKTCIIVMLSCCKGLHSSEFKITLFSSLFLSFFDLSETIYGQNIPDTYPLQEYEVNFLNKIVSFGFGQLLLCSYSLCADSNNNFSQNNIQSKQVDSCLNNIT